MLGDAGVGKTFILHRFIGKNIDEGLMPTISVEYTDKLVEMSNGQQIKAELWDTGKYSFSYKFICGYWCGY